MLVDLNLERENFAAEQQKAQEALASPKPAFNRTLRLGDLPNLRSPHPLGLEDLKVKVVCLDSQAARLYCLGVEDRVFYGLNLLELITSSRPDKKKGQLKEVQGRGDFIGDTSEYFNPARRVSKGGLMSRHLHHLDPWWSECTAHHLGRYDLAVRTLDPQEAREKLSTRCQKLIEVDYAAANLPMFVKRAARYDSYYYWNVYHFLKRQPQLLTDLGLDIKSFRGEGWQARLRSLMHHFPENFELRKQWVRTGLLEVNASNMLFAIDTTLQPHNAISTTYPVSVYKTDYLGNNRVRLHLNGSWVEGDLNQDRFTPDRWSLLDPSTQGLSPLISWLHTHATGKDIYLAGAVPDIIKDDFVPQADTNLGLVLAASLSDQTRNSLPRRLSYYDISGETPPEGKKAYKQYMMEAQQPLMLSIFRSLVVTAPIFTAVRDLVDSSLD